MPQGSGELIGIIRPDGLGELRGEGFLARIRGANADEVRALVIQRAMAVAAERGERVSLRAVDVDAVYPLSIDADGTIREEGPAEPLRDRDDELTPEGAAPKRPGDGRAGDGHEGYDADLHPALRLPRPEMMSRHPDHVFAGATSSQAAQLADAEPDYERDDAEEALLDDEAEAAATAPEREADDADDLDEHDEALADGDVDEEPAPAASVAGRLDGLRRPRAAARVTPPLSEEELAEIEREHESRRLAAAAADEAEAEKPAAPEALAALGELDQAPMEPEAEEWTPSYPRARLHPERPLELPDAPPTPRARRASTSPVDAEPVRTSPARPGGRTTPVPTLDDFLSDRDEAADIPATKGWRASLRRSTGGLVKLGPGARERREREEVQAIQRTFDGSKTIVVVNPKGGAHKTTASLMIAAIFGMLRGGYTLAWDNNETRGTLGWRSKPGPHRNTAVDLLRQLPHFEISGGATIGDIDRFVRNQGEAKFDVLASDDDAASAAIIDDEAFSRLHRTLSRFYRILVVDTGNNMRASNWEAALDVADQLVIVTTHREDTAASAAWLADGLRERGHEELLRNAVTILSSPAEKDDRQLTRRLVEHFEQLTRAVVEVPYDHEFVGGGQLEVMRLAPATREAWRHAAAVIAEGL
ncbi:ESX-1 secretion-associated protein EspI [Pseudoclavibacter triregionum]|nr:ESX-1 secretion-associated protein EspI [Pseudoclavibacter triregionum]